MKANPERGEYSLVFKRDGQEVEYVLKVSIGPSMALQKKYGKPLGKILEMTDELDVEAIADVFRMMLQKHHAEEFKNAAAAHDLIDEIGGPFKAYQALVQALVAGRSEGNANPQTAPLQTGGASTSTPEA